MVIPAYVLAGGRSERMGQDKALLKIDGIALADRLASVLQDAGCKDIHLVGRQPSLQHLGWPVIVDESPSHHPLHGVAAALYHCPGPMALICPCDLITLLPNGVRQLLAHSGPCVAEANGQIHPLLAVLPTDMAPLAAQFATSSRSAQAFVAGIPRINLPDGQLFDANRPTDLRHALTNDVS